jgi:hypothetical protein
MKELTRRKFLKVSVVGLASMALGACEVLKTEGPLVEEKEVEPKPTELPRTPTKPADIPTNTPTILYEATKVQGATATKPAEVTPTLTPVPVPDVQRYTEDEYTEVQKRVIEADKAQLEAQAQALTKWWRYWGQAMPENVPGGRPFDPLSQKLFQKMVFNDAEAPSKAMMVLQSPDYPNTSFFLPIINSQFQTEPPTVDKPGFTIPVGYGPLQLSEVMTYEQAKNANYPPQFADTKLVAGDGTFVRIDPTTKEVIATLNMEKARWEPVPVVMDTVDMEVLGKVVPFEISAEKNGIQKTTWSKWGIEELTTNPNLKDKNNKFMLLTTSMLWILSDAGYAGLSYEEFMKNPDKYPINSIPGTEKFWLREVNKINYKFLDINDPRLEGPDGGPKSGYIFKNGELTILETTNEKYFKAYNSWIENDLGNPGLGPLLADNLILLPWRLMALSNDNSLKRQHEILDISGYPWQRPEGHENVLDYVSKNGYWSFMFTK